MLHGSKEPVEVHIGGEVFKATPITGRDFAAFRAWVESQMLEKAKASLGDTATGETRNDIAFTCEVLGNVTLTHVFNAMNSFEGRCWLLWKAINKNHADLTYEGFLEIVTLRDLTSIQGILDRLSGTEIVAEEGTGGGDPLAA